MKPMIKNGAVMARWVKQSYGSKKASELLQNRAYVQLHDFGSEKVLAFRKAIHRGDVLPEQLSEVDESEFKQCEARRRKNENNDNFKGEITK